MTNPIANPGQFAAEADVVAMWQDDKIIQARTIVARMFEAGYGDRPPEECLPSFDAAMDEYVTNWLFKAASSDAQHPRFVRNFMGAYSWHGHDVPGARTGGDNPDNCYRLAGIAHGTGYRVTGHVVDKQAANVSFTLTGNYGTSVTIQTIEDHELDRADDGSFAITIDDQPANGRPNHLTTQPHVKFLFVRDSMDDWATETPFDLSIERLGPPSSPPLTVAQMAERAAFRAREDVPLYFWFQNVWTSRRLNTVSEPQLNRGLGGLVTQGLSHGHFELGDDDAVILDYEPAAAAYVAIELTSWWYQSIDYGNIQSSLTRAQSVTDDDGRVRCVIAKRDPGVANWLDTGGLSTVLMILRWQKLPADPVRGGPTLHMRVVRAATLRDALPPDTIWFTQDQRVRQLAMRRAAFARRFAS